MLLIFGVRPNSPVPITSVDSSRPADFQVLDQRGERLVVRRDELAVPGEEFLVAVPVRFLAVVLAVVDRDEVHAAFDQPSGQQHALAEAMPAVVIADTIRLPGNVE